MTTDYEMIRSELTTTSIETGKEYKATLQYDPRTGNARVVQTGFFGIAGNTVILNNVGEFTDVGNRHLDEATKKSWKEQVVRDINATYEKAGGTSNNMRLPGWVRNIVDPPPPPPDEDEFEEVGSISFNNDEALEKAFDLRQNTDNFLQRLSLKNLKYPIDADYGNTQDYIQINQFTYRAPNPSVLFPTERRESELGRDFSIPYRDPEQVTNYYAGAGDTLLFGVQSRTPKEVPLGLVKLPMPNQLNDSNNVAWGEDQLNALTAAAATIASGGFQETLDFVDKALRGDFKGPFDALNAIFQGAGEKGRGIIGFLEQAKQNPNSQLNARSVVGSSILNLLGFGVSPEAILARGAGVIPNSNLQLLFNAPALRAFRFDWKMSPRSREEAIRINNIIRFFKQGMAAKKMMNDAGRSYFLGTPNVFDITFKTSKTNQEITNTNNSVLRIKTCACVGAAVNYTPEGMWNAYEKGQPTSCVLSLQFKELEPLYNTDYDEDPFNYDNLIGFIPENAIGY